MAVVRKYVLKMILMRVTVQPVPKDYIDPATNKPPEWTEETTFHWVNSVDLASFETDGHTLSDAMKGPEAHKVAVEFVSGLQEKFKDADYSRVIAGLTKDELKDDKILSPEQWIAKQAELQEELAEFNRESDVGTYGADTH